MQYLQQTFNGQASASWIHIKREHLVIRSFIPTSISVNLQIITWTRMRSIYPLIQPLSLTCLPSSPIVTLCPTQEKVKCLPLHDKSPTPQAWQIVSSATMQWILDASCTKTWLACPLEVILSNTPRRVVCMGFWYSMGSPGWAHPNTSDEDNIGVGRGQCQHKLRCWKWWGAQGQIC